MPPMAESVTASTRNCARDVRAGGADGEADADLARPLGHRHEHDVHDADAADEEGDAGGDREQERREGAARPPRVSIISWRLRTEKSFSLVLLEAVALTEERPDARLRLPPWRALQPRSSPGRPAPGRPAEPRAHRRDRHHHGVVIPVRAPLALPGRSTDRPRTKFPDGSARRPGRAGRRGRAARLADDAGAAALRRRPRRRGVRAWGPPHRRNGPPWSRDARDVASRRTTWVAMPSVRATVVTDSDDLAGMARASSSVSVGRLMPRTPDDTAAPGHHQMRLVPTAAIWAPDVRAPTPSALVATTAATPMRMPSR